MSSFDPNLFLQASFTEPTKKRPPLDVGEYNGILGAPKTRSWASKDGTKSGMAIDIPVTLEIPGELQVRLGLEKPTVQLTYGIMLDLNDAGMIDQSPGKNRGIRILREAVDKNKPGDVFSPAMHVEGKAVRCKVSQRIGNDGEPVDQIDSISKL